ncbi:phage tail spike protein [Leuconostoc lactis]|uniref:phage tail spike protein n=1 Tax=Leuconostoc lactis TaxID=1246 RepID=UPI000A044915|nr:phage tail spike protein [Leuconostoc lactis]ORI85702.1 hypothetical protein BMS94_00690 [Leuconostoc lactis]ORI87966.1 hypothetical protein BMS96_00695 [Leuconostoc lactis]
MIYIFDKKQAIIKVLTNDDFTAAHLNFKINTATTFEFSLPASKALPSGSKYVATPHPLDDSKFIMLRLTERVDNTETIDYSAYELAYQELATDGYIEDKRPHNQSALNLMKIALDGSNWELNNVNVSGTATANFYYVDRLGAISKVVDLLGGEIVFYIEIQGNAISGRYMDYLARQAADTSKVFASGSNLLTVERQSDTSGIYTAILPRGKGKEIDNGDADTPDGYGRRINIADVEWKRSAGKPLDKPKGSIVLSDPDATAEWGQINGNARLLLQTYDDIDDINVLINSAYKTLQSVNHPQIQYSATVADVGGLSLGDTVLIMHGDRDLSYKTRVFEVKYDLLSPDQTELSLGDDLSSNSITSQLNSLNAVADTTSSQTQWTINQIGRPSTTFGNTEPANPKVGDVFFKESPDGGTEIHRWNGNIWELIVSPTTADDIDKAVNDAVSQAKAHTDEVKQGLSSDIATAKSQAASLANAAEANAKSEATSLFSRAQNALSDAKTDLMESIASEASQAVATANSQAQAYVNQAKSDINDTINALSVGGRNLYLNSRVLADGYGTNGDVTVTVEPFDSTTNMWHIVAPQRPGTGVGIYIWDYAGGKIPNNSDWSYSADIKGTGKVVRFGIEDSNRNPIKGTIGSEWSRISQTGHVGESQYKTLNIYFETTNSPLDVYIKLPKLETGNIATDWSPAPEDVVLDYTTKDNKIKETITQYQETNDGKVRKAQTDATTALGLVETKVSQTDYDKKTGDLSSHINDVKQTADRSAQTIADIKEADGKRDFKIAEIEHTAGEIKSTVSDLKTAQDKQSGYISTLQQTAKGFEATATKVDNLSVGGRNLFLNSKKLWDVENNGNGSSTKVTFDDTTNMWHITAPSPVTGGRGIYFFQTSNTSKPLVKGDKWAMSIDIKGTGMLLEFGAEGSTNQTQPKGPIPSEWTRLSSTGTAVSTGAIIIYFGAGADTTQALDVYVKLPKLELGNMPTDWSPAPEDVDSTIAKVKLTADEASAAVGKLTSTDGVITKAQAAIKLNADAINEKVSKTVYDQKTGELLRNINEAKDTADKSLRTISDYKTSNDKRVHDAESSIERTANAITEKVSKTDYDKKTGELTEAVSQVKITADDISKFVRDSSGNISSDFQTALSKTSIIAGSTLASSIQKQTATQISSALTDNNGKIISLINQDSSGVQIAGKNLAITADTTVDGNFWAKQVNAVKVNATNITAGTLNAKDVNIINLDVNSLTGNVSNFIQSNWNGKYQSTSITSDGMQIGGFSANGFDTIFDKTGITFETADSRYGYAIAHYGTDAIKGKSGQVAAHGMEIRTGKENGVGFDYLAIKSPGANNLEFGNTTNAGHVSIMVVPDTKLMPMFNQGVTILDDLYVGNVNGAKAGGFFSILVGRTVRIPTSIRSDGTVEKSIAIDL